MITWFRPTTLEIDTGSVDTGFATMRITSRFGVRVNPLNPSGPQVFHGGLDIGNARLGDEVVAAADGTVVAAGVLLSPWSDAKPSTAPWPERNYGGIMVVLDHGGGFVSIYAHLRKAVAVIGGRVVAGAKIGEVGETGAAMGQGHLHFGIKQNGKDVDPLPLLQLRGALKVSLFSDIAGSSFEAAIRRVTEFGIFSVPTDKKFNPKGLVTREQLAAVVDRVLSKTGSYKP